jgi:anti-sigma-K factor RskA
MVIGEHPDRDDLVAFSLGALEPKEAAEVEAHAPSCARCSRELEALEPAVAVLGESVEQIEPPPELRERVLGIVRREAETEDAELATPQRPRRRLPALLFRPATGLAALGIAAAGVGGYLIADNGGIGGESTEPVVAQAGIGGTLTVGENSSMLDLHGLEQLSGKQVYQVWVAHGSSVRPSSSFLPDGSGHGEAAVDGHLEAGTKVMVTREPHAGQTTPTPPVLITATVE